jgi:hypothetical protein
MMQACCTRARGQAGIVTVTLVGPALVWQPNLGVGTRPISSSSERDEKKRGMSLVALKTRSW